MRLNYNFVKIWLLHLGTLIGIVILPISYFLWSLVVYFFLASLFQLIFHDWICHEYRQPKNSWIEAALLLVFYSHDNNVSNKKNYHVLHHRMWNRPELDPTYRKLEGVSLLRYIMGLQNNLDLGVPNKEYSLTEKSKLVKILDKHSRLTYFVWVVCIFLLLPISWFVVVCIFYPWLVYVLSCYHDWHLHGPKKNSDKSWMTLLYYQGAWHYAHHESWRQEYYGPGLWRYINPAWYYRIVLFK